MKSFLPPIYCIFNIDLDGCLVIRYSSISFLGEITENSKKKKSKQLTIIFQMEFLENLINFYYLSKLLR